jgi:diacylglycerol kinase (ATP)
LTKRIALLYNTRAGKGKARRLATWLEQKLQALDCAFELFKNEWPSELKEYTDIWIVGGDGTLNFFINKYPDCKLPLFIFSGGTGNDFAWKLYGNKSLNDCFEAALHAAPRNVDAGICNEKYFLNGLGIGFDGEIVKSIRKAKFLFSGHLAYYATVIRKMFFFREKELVVNTNEISWNDQSFMLTIANGSRYGGGFLVAPHARVDDGMLDIVLIPRISIFQRINLLPKAGKGKHLSIARITKSGFVTVKADQKLLAHYDGEPMEAKKFEVTVLPAKFLFRY